MRQNLSKSSKKFPLPNLANSQVESYHSLIKEGLKEVIAELGIIQDESERAWQLEFSEPNILKPNLTIEEATEKGKSYDAPLFIRATLKDPIRKLENVQNIYIGDIPMMTDKATFVINGNEKIVQHLLVRAEGVYFSSEESKIGNQILGGAEIRTKNGSWVSFETSRNGVISVKIDKKRKFPATVLLKAFGVESDDEIRALFKDSDTNPELSYIESTLLKDVTRSKEEAAIEIYKKMKPGEPAILDDSMNYLNAVFFNPSRYSLGKVGRFKINQKFNLDTPNDENHRLLTKEDLVNIINELIKINNGVAEADDIDHLGNRRLKSVGEMLQMEIRNGFLNLRKNVLDKISLQPRDSFPEPKVFVSNEISSKITSFFNTGKTSIQQDQYNPLTRLDILRRTSSGLTKERASIEVRDMHYSQYGKICAVRTPEGPNIGLVTFLAVHAQVNDYGFIETPYFALEKDGDKVRVTDQIVYLAAYEEDNHYIIGNGVEMDEKGYLVEKQVPLRKKGEFLLGDSSLADYIDVDSAQVLGISAGLIPFVQSDDIARALVASSQMSQAVPLIRPEAPIVGTGIEDEIAKNSGWVIYAENDGVVEYADSTKVSIKYSGEKEVKTYKATKFKKSNQETCYNQVVKVSNGQKVKQCDVLIEGPSIINGELSIGTNVRAAYMVWNGYEFEDGIVISDRLVKEDVLTSIHIEIHKCEVLETKLGPEEITRDIPSVSEDSLKNLDKNGIVYIGAKVGPGDILVGKVAPKGEGDLSAEERLLRAIFNEKAKEVRNTSLFMENGERGTVIDVKRLTRKDNKLDNGVVEKIEVYIARRKKVEIGDKLAGRHGNKGVISAIVPSVDMPHTEDGTPIDIIFSADSVLKRMNIGQTYEVPLGMAGRKLGKKYTIPVLTQLEDSRIEKELLEAGLPANGKAKLIDGRTGEYFQQDITMGEGYIVKLHHMAEDKIHARSTGPYNLITQQPQHGKQNMGGQRLGEMEVWAIESYGAANLLQEMLTIKSDDMIGRNAAYTALITGQEIPEPTVPESFKLLVREFNGLGLGIEALEAIREAVEQPEVSDLIEKETFALDPENLETEQEALSEVDENESFENEEEI